MLALAVRYLTGYAVATDLSRQRAEWPPHPGRIFMAMAAAHFETGGAAEERAALEWLETAPAPAMNASHADERSLVRTYVPVNDDHGGIVRRSRQHRAFPRVRPHRDSVFLIWTSEPEKSIRDALGRLCRKVTRVGHSSSVVQMWLSPPGEVPEPNLVPVDRASEFRLRVPSRGTLAALEEAFNGAAIEEYDRLQTGLATANRNETGRIKAELQLKFGSGRPASRRPVLAYWQGYDRPRTEAAEQCRTGPYNPIFLVLTKLKGPALGLEATLALTGALRNTAMKAAGANPPEWLTGHNDAGGPSLASHAAFFPLPYVGAELADGRVLGLGIAVPGGLAPAQLKSVLGPLLFDADTGEESNPELWSRHWRWTLQRETRERPPVALRRTTWTGPAKSWASVTPVVLHHYPKKNRNGDIARILREAFVSAGFPEPGDLETRSVSAHTGAGHAMSLPQFTEGGAGLCRYQTHVWVRFDQPVSGPVLVGRGRFRGYGLFRPVEGEEAA